VTRAHLSIGAAVAVAAVSPAAALAAHHHHHHKAKPRVVKVDVQDDMYSKSSVRLHKGSEIKWEWDAANYDSHNVKVLKAPKDAHKFSSPSGTTGITFKHVFTKVGTYQLYCTIHPDTMTMTVVVKP
jgi:plastocyanin